MSVHLWTIDALEFRVASKYRNPFFRCIFSGLLMLNAPWACGQFTIKYADANETRSAVTSETGQYRSPLLISAQAMTNLPVNRSDITEHYNNNNKSGVSNNTLGANEVSEAAVTLNAFSAQYERMASKFSF
jgi:hypothetical protein